MNKLTGTLVGALALILAPSCTESDDDEGVGGGGGAAGGTTSSSTGGTTSGDGGGGDSGCIGDQEAWDAIQKENISCTSNSDCCVVINSCLAAGQIVHVSDYEEAQQVWPYCDPVDCPMCILPSVDVACVDGVCAGETLDPTSGDGMDESHCGVDDDPVMVTMPATVFGC